MKSKIAGCTHHASKVLKMAGGGSVPGKLKTMGPPNVKKLQEKTKKNPDGSQAYVRGERTSDRLDTLIRSNRMVGDAHKKNRDMAETVRGDNAKHAATMKRWDQLSKAEQAVFDQFMTELDRKK
jgi:hypothetical protein